MANVQILNVAHALIAGTRGAAGGAPSKDSIVGVALVQGNVVSFGGRRGGVLRFKTHKKADLVQVVAKFESKLSGNPFGKNVDGVYSQIEASAFESLLPDFDASIGRGYYKAMAGKKLNTRATKEQPPKAVKVEKPVVAGYFPTAAGVAAKAKALACYFPTTYSMTH